MQRQAQINVYRKCPTDENLKKCKTHRNYLTNLVRKTKNDDYKCRMIMAGNNGKKVLDLINNAIGKTKNRPQIASAFDEANRQLLRTQRQWLIFLINIS